MNHLYQKDKDLIFMRRATDNKEFEEYPLIVQPQSLLALSPQNDLYCIPINSIGGNDGSGSVTSSYALAALTASYAMNGGGDGGFTLTTGSTYPITSSWAVSASWASSSISSSYAYTASWALNTVNGSEATLITGSTYHITASWAVASLTASYISSSATFDKQVYTLTASFATSASYYPASSSWASASISSSYAPSTGDATLITGYTYPITSSWAISASWASSSLSSSYSLTASYALTGGDGGASLTPGATYQITSSWATNALTASYISSSATWDKQVYALTASQTISASYAPVEPAYSASVSIVKQNTLTNTLYVLTASLATSASYYPLSCSWASASISSSYALTASYALNGGHAGANVSVGYFSDSWTLTNNEDGQLLVVSSSNVVSMSVPTGLNQGFACSFFQSGSGQVSVISGSNSVNVRNRAGFSSSYAQYSAISLMQLDTNNNYFLQGDLG